MELGKHLMEPNAANPKGFFENEAVSVLQERLMQSLQGRWDHTGLYPDNWWLGEECRNFSLELQNILDREFATAPLWAVKDPRTCRLLEWWRPVLDERGVEAKYPIIFRRPWDVVDSLARRDGFLFEKSLQLWLNYNLEAEKSSRGNLRVFISSDEFMNDWRTAVEKVAIALNITWPVSPESVSAKVESFLDRSMLKTASAPTNYADSPLYKRAMRVYGIFQKAASTGQVPDAAEMDDIYHENAEELEKPQYLHLSLSEAITRAEKAECNRNAEVDALSIAMKSLQSSIEQLNHAVHEKDAHIANISTSLRVAITNTRAEESRNKDLSQQIGALQGEIRYLQNCIQEILSSTSWRITQPIRMARRIQAASTQLFHPNAFKGTVKRSIRILQREGVKGIVHRLERLKVQDETYNRWLELYGYLSSTDRTAIQRHIVDLPYKPLISVLMPVYNVDVKWLRYAIDSVLCQLYPHWELCIADDCSTAPEVKKTLDEYAARDFRVKITYRDKNGHISEASNSALRLAQGEFVALLDNDDMITEDALYHVACALNQNPDLDLIYSDEDFINKENQRSNPYFKSGWNPDLLFSQNYFCHLGVYRKSLLEQIGGFRAGLEGSQDYDLVLRAYAKSNDAKVHHIPRILYHWRAIEGSTALTIESKTYAVPAARRALQDYFDNNHHGAVVEDALWPGYHHVVWPLPEPEPEVSLIIPTRDQVMLLRQCVDSIVELTDYKNYRIIIVDNQSEEPETLDYFRELQSSRQAEVISYNHPFNFSAINNYAVRQVNSGIIGLINNDIEVISAGWLKEMVRHALRPEIGVVGAKLLYPDLTIQHGGVKLGCGAETDPVAGHLFHGLPRTAPGYGTMALLTHALSAVTGACMVMRKSVFEEVDGFNEKDLAVAFNDIDLCMKIRAQGYRIIWTPHAELIHHESASRGKDDISPEKWKRFLSEVKYMRDTWGKSLDNDPYYNPNLHQLRGDFSLAFPPRLTKPWLMQDIKAA